MAKYELRKIYGSGMGGARPEQVKVIDIAEGEAVPQGAVKVNGNRKVHDWADATGETEGEAA